MERYEGMKRNKGSGKSIVAMARKLAVIIWTMLSRGEGFDEAQMRDGKLAAKAGSMREAGARRTEDLAARASGGAREEAMGRGQEIGGTEKQARIGVAEKKTKKKLVS
jgi:hypothetical protein